MRKDSTPWAVVLCACLLTACSPRDPALEQAELIVDAFYSFDPVPLRVGLDGAEQADAVLYYQGWARGADYKVHVRRPCSRQSPQRVTCAVTVTDAFGQALGYTATDTFTFITDETRVTAVSFSGDDPPVFETLLGWIARHRPAVMQGPCKDSFSGGTTPTECARAVADAARAFAARR